MAKLYNLAAMTVANTGAGVLTLGSAATIMGVLYLSFAAAGASDGETLAYSISDVGASEEGTAVYSSTGPTITRTPVKSTNGNAAINVTSAAIVRISPAKEDIANLRENNTFTGTQTINPTTGTTNQALAITQTSQASGSVAGPLLFNKTDVTNAGVGASGSGTWDNFGIKNLIYSHRFTMSITGASAGAGSSALAGITNIAAAADGFGSTGGVTITGANPAGHNAWGHIGYGIGFVNSSIGVLIGMEGEVGVGTGGTVSFRIGVGANSQGPVKGSNLDAAFAVSTINGNIPGSSTTSAPFDHLMAITGTIYTSATAFPIASTGDFFYSDTAGTVAHFANLPNVTVSGNILSFPKVVITGDGGASFGLAAATPNAGQLFVGKASAGQVLLQAATNITTGVDAVVINDVSGNNILVAGVGEAANTATRFGQALANQGEVIVNGSSNVGMLVGTVGNHPLILGTNDAARITVTGAGNVGIGNTSPKNLLDVNANLTSSPALTLSTSLARFQAADTSQGGAEFVSYGSNPGNFVIGVSAGGTAASPAVTPGQKHLLNLRGYGYNSSAFALGGIITIKSINAWSASDQSTQIDFFTTPGGSTTIALAMQVNPSGGLSIGTAMDPGLGGLALHPGSSITPASNGDLVFQATSNTSFTVKYKGSDGTVRSGSITLS